MARITRGEARRQGEMKLPKYYWWIGAVAAILIVAILRWERPYTRDRQIGYVICAAAGLIFIIKMIRDFGRQ